jgi:hypothetical protein
MTLKILLFTYGSVPCSEVCPVLGEPLVLAIFFLSDNFLFETDSGWPRIFYVAQAGLKLVILMPQPPKCRNCRNAPPYYPVSLTFYMVEVCQ